MLLLCYWQKQEACISSVDFTSALHHVRPSVQRGSDVFITNMARISWNDIGGLDDVKEKLKQVLLLADVEPLMFPFTARCYASAVLGIVILSVCPSVTCVLCDKTK